jgi:hypothetical protein
VNDDQDDPLVTEVAKLKMARRPGRLRKGIIRSVTSPSQIEVEVEGGALVPVTVPEWPAITTPVDRVCWFTVQGSVLLLDCVLHAS